MQNIRFSDVMLGKTIENQLHLSPNTSQNVDYTSINLALMDQTPSHSCFTPNATQQHSTQHIVAIPRSDRWQAHYRLQELGIPCACLEDGRLQVEVTNPIAVAQLWSVLQQLTRSRKQLSNWLERCWDLSAS